MTKIRNFAALLALSGVAVLPACSMFGSDNSSSRSSRASYSSQGYAAAPNYNTASQAPAAPELTPDMIRNVQQALQQDGKYQGRVDGVWGPGTQAAVRTYQQQHNMNATGQLDQDTLAAMNLGVAPNAQQPGSQRYGSNSAPNYDPPPNGNTNPPNTNTTR